MGEVDNPLGDYQALKTDSGSLSVSLSDSGGAYASRSVSFSQSFSQPPAVTVGMGNAQVNVVISSVTTRGFTLAYYAINGGSQEADTDWNAVGI